MSYEAFGEQIHAQGVTVNTHLYVGEQYAPALGLYYNRARYLSTNHGRFWNADVFEGFQSDPQSLHRYLYAHADPVNGWDPSGYVSLSEMMGKMKISSVISSISSLSRVGAMRVVGVGVVKMLKISFYALEAYAFITNPSQYVADTIRDGFLQKMLQGKGKMAVRFQGMVKKYLPFIKANAARVGQKVDNVWDGVHYVVRGNGGGAAKRIPQKPIIVGEDMARVQQYADEVGSHAYRLWKNDPFDFDLSMRRNERWIRDQMRDGREIIDIGPAFRRRSSTGRISPFYEMERRNLDGYDNCRKVFERSGSAGGVPGLDF